MIRRIILKNFMAHADTELELVPGLNVLAGPNNSGKSAVATALWILSALPTREGDYMLRHGERECSVAVETSEGHRFVWKRGKSGGTSISINGEEIPRLGTASEAARQRLHEHLRMPPVVSEDGKEEFDVHIAHQKEPIFLLGRDAAAAMFFASSSDADRLLRMQSLFRERARERRAERVRRLESAARLRGEVVRLEPLDAIGSRITHAESDHQQLLAEIAKAERIALDLRSLESTREQLRALGVRLKALEPLQSPPALTDTAPLALCVAGLAECLRRRNAEEGRRSVLADLKDPPSVTDDSELARLGSSLVTARAATRRLRATHDILQPMAEPPALTETTELERLVQSIAAQSDSTRLLRARSTRLETIDPPPEPTDDRALALLVTQIAEQFREADACRARLRTAEEELAAWLRDNPNCPHCGSPVQATSLLSEHQHA